MSSGGQALGGVVGGVIGFFVGGPVGALRGAQLGIMAGGLIDPPKGPTINGPRLEDLNVQTSTYGAFIPRNYGTVAQSGNVFWIQGDAITEVQTTTTSGGKGGPEQTTNTWSYYATFAVGLCKGPIDGVRRIWIGGQLWYDAGSDDFESIVASNEAAQGFTLYIGTDTQTADPLIQADKGAANVPAYRGLAYIVFDTLPLEKYGNSLMGAQVMVELVNSGALATSIIEASSFAIPTTGNTIAVRGNVLVVGGTNYTGLAFYNAGVAAYPTLVSHDSPVDFAPIATIFSDDLVAVGRVNGFSLYDGAGNLLSSVTTTQPSGIALVDGYLYVGTVASTIMVYDITDTSAPSFVLAVSLPIRPTTMLTVGDMLYCFEGPTYPDPNIVLVDVSVASLPLYVSTTVVDTDISQCIYEDGYFYASSNPEGLTIYSVDGITGPVQVGRVAYSNNAIYEFCAKFSDYVLVKGQVTGATIIDVSDLANPVELYTDLSSPSTKSLSFKDGYFYFNKDANNGGVYYIAPNIVTPNSALLGDIVEAECLTSKLLTAGDIDVTELTDTVRGYRVSQIGAIRGGLDPLRAAWPFDVVQHGYQILFKRRGSASVATIPSTLLDARAAGESPGVQITDSREMDLMLPRRVDVKYLDSVREYDINEQMSPERTSTDAAGIRKVDLPIVFTGAEAAQKAETLLYLYWLERYDVVLRLPPEYSELEPGDVITVTSDTADYELRLTSINTLPDGRMECAAKYNKAAIYTPVARGEEGQSTAATLALGGASVYSLLDIPLLRDDDDTAGFPVAMAGYLSGWPGGILYRSDDGGQTWADLRAFAPGAVIGYAGTPLAAHGGTVIDFSSRLTVRLYAGTIASVTQAQMFAGQNWFAYGADGRWEIIAAATAVLQGDGSYILSDFLRGQRGTEWATGLHSANDRIVLLDANSLAFISVNSSTIGTAREYRGITTGKALSSDSSLSFAYSGVNLECLSPVHLTGSRHPSTNDWTLTWTRRSRYDQWRDYVDAPLGEASESYEIDVFSSGTYTTLKRTITASSATAAYTSAQQVTDFGSNQGTLYLKVYQLSATVGRGYPLTQSITR